jgi:hypothetical protein
MSFCLVVIAGIVAFFAMCDLISKLWCNWDSKRKPEQQEATPKIPRIGSLRFYDRNGRKIDMERRRKD